MDFSLFFPTVFPAPTLFTSLSSLFCVIREGNRFLQRGYLTDGIEDGGCKTCYSCNKQKKKDISSLFMGAGGWKEKILGTHCKSSKQGQGPTIGSCSNGFRCYSKTTL